MNDWEKYIERRSKNIGFLSRLGSFRDPTPAEIQRAILIETKAWQESKGKKKYTTSEEYSISRRNEKPTLNHIRLIEIKRKEPAVKAYINTLMDPENILKMQGVDVSNYEIPTSFFKKIILKIIKIFPSFADQTHPNMSFAEKQEFQEKLKEKK